MARYTTQLTIDRLENGKRYYNTVIPQNPTEAEFPYTHVARIGDRWDTLAAKYLGSATLWYVIANANESLNGSIFIKPGTEVIIPEG